MSFEKLLVIGVIAAFLIGPTRLPAYAAKLGQFVRSLRRLADDVQQQVREEVGDSVDLDWRRYDPRQYDPRRIIREALLAEPGPEPASRSLERSAPDAP
ncbi:Sec-independent protein translocase subunit TatA/TatB [Leifsonia sp. P73]|uniref:Sec-independent protein translocase subunit TatA/TatB n=1 Tax=Leifsonia sp. P73 TaxID=3423959 RepID=UPI003DA371D3